MMPAQLDPARVVRAPDGTYKLVGSVVRGVVYNGVNLYIETIEPYDPVVWFTQGGLFFATPDEIQPSGALLSAGRLERVIPFGRWEQGLGGIDFPLFGVALGRARPGESLEVAGVGSVVPVRMPGAGGAGWIGDNGGATLQVLPAWPASSGKVLGHFCGTGVLASNYTVVLVNPH